MPRYVFITGCVDGEHEFEVHREGCRDISRKTQFMGADSYKVEAESAEEAVRQESEEFIANEQDWYADRDFKILPCCKKSNEGWRYKIELTPHSRNSASFTSNKIYEDPKKAESDLMKNYPPADYPDAEYSVIPANEG